ncbi:MAG: 5'-nucleotidase C-terminal domain-containing protein, partial [Arenibacterium sp.]
RELANDHAETLASLERPAGKSDRPLHSYFTFIARDRSLAVVAAAQAAAVRPHLDTSWAKDLPLLSAVSPGKFGARAGPTSFTDVPAGPLLHRHLVDLQIFPNKLRVVLVTGAQIRDWLEMSASLFRRIKPCSDGDALLNPDVPGHEFDVLHVLTYEFALSQEARFFPDGRLRSRDNHRVMNVLHNGEPVGPDQLFVVAVNNFRANGGGHFAALRNAQPVTIPPISIREALRDYLSGTYPRDPVENMPQPWRFRPMPGTSVSILTGPGARDHLDEIADQEYSVLGIDEQGFLRLRVEL